MMPAASVRAAYIAAMTKRVKILCAGIPIEVKRLPGVGHLVFEEAPEACEIVASFAEARTRAPAAS